MSGKRVKGKVFVQPIIHGSVSHWLGPNSDQFKSHHWFVYVRGLANEDLSYLIEKVEFKLHETLPNPIRSIKQPPYKVEDHGWVNLKS
mmetsp:Transcript_2502/g.4404  ORF Transcript_2502/g.4404 Transcript_2502/m.4404 type:complete len:88 (-) Transcript_2502:1186-1449(-)